MIFHGVHSYDALKCSKRCSETCGSWLYLSFEHFMTSFLWSIRVQTFENCGRFVNQKVLRREVFSPKRSLNQPKATRVCIRSINQSNRSISVRLLFLFCSRVFISRSLFLLFLLCFQTAFWLFLLVKFPANFFNAAIRAELPRLQLSLFLSISMQSASYRVPKNLTFKTKLSASFLVKTSPINCIKMWNTMA